MTMRDERIQSVLHRSRSTGFAIFFFGMLAIFVFRQLYLRQSVSEYGDFFLVWIVAGGCAILASALRGGVDTSADKQSRGIWLVSLVAALAVTCVQVYTNITEGIGFGEPMAWVASLLTFAFAFVFSLVSMTLVQCFLRFLYRRWERLNLE